MTGPRPLSLLFSCLAGQVRALAVLHRGDVSERWRWCLHHLELAAGHAAVAEELSFWRRALSLRPRVRARVLP